MHRRPGCSHGNEKPCRSIDELRDLIHACGLRYEEIDGRFWDAAFDSGWAPDEATEEAAVAAYRRALGAG